MQYSVASSSATQKPTPPTPHPAFIHNTHTPRSNHVYKLIAIPVMRTHWLLQQFLIDGIFDGMYAEHMHASAGLCPLDTKYKKNYNYDDKPR